MIAIRLFKNMNELKRPFDFIYTAVRIGSFYYFFVNCKAVEILKKIIILWHI